VLNGIIKHSTITLQHCYDHHHHSTVTPRHCNTSKLQQATLHHNAATLQHLKANKTVTCCKINKYRSFKRNEVQNPSIKSAETRD